VTEDALGRVHVMAISQSLVILWLHVAVLSKLLGQLELVYTSAGLRELLFLQKQEEAGFDLIERPDVELILGLRVVEQKLEHAENRGVVPR